MQIGTEVIPLTLASGEVVKFVVRTLTQNQVEIAGVPGPLEQPALVVDCWYLNGDLRPNNDQEAQWNALRDAFGAGFESALAEIVAAVRKHRDD